MSSDLFDDEDQKGNSLSLEMNVHGTLSLCAMAKEHREPGDHEPDIVTVTFNAKEDGIARVRRLRDALNEWLTHIERTT